jgi:hypothetical protein
VPTRCAVALIAMRAPLITMNPIVLIVIAMIKVMETLFVTPNQF